MTERELNALPVELSSQLRYLDRRVRGLAVLRGMGVVCVVLCAGVGCGVLTDWLFDLGVGIRTAVLLGVLGGALAAVVTAIIRPLVRRSSSAELAALVDTSFPDLRERIESTVELSDPDLPESHKGSAYMRSRLLRESVRQADGVDFGAAADTSSAFRWTCVALLCFLLIVAPFGLSKEGYGLMLSRFLTPWRNLERATNLYFEIPDGDRTVARGDDVVIRALPRWRLAPGELPDHAWLRWQNADGETDRRRMEWSESSAAYTAMLSHVFTSFDYEVSAGRARTRTYHIDVVERPDILELTLEIVPPAYTRQATQTLDGAVGRTEVFERSELMFDLAFSKPVESAEFVWLSDATLADDGSPSSVGRIANPSAKIHDIDKGTDDADRVPLELNADQTRGRLTFDAVRSGPYAVILRDNRDLPSLPNVSRELIVIPDMPPQVVWTDLDPSQVINIAPLEARPDDSLSLPVHAVDDVGVDELVLHVEVIQRGEILGPLVAETPLLGQPAVPHRFDMELSDFALREGDLLSVRARAVDGRPVPEPQAAWSPARLIRISKDADPAGLRALMQQQQRLRDAIEQIQQDVREDRETARDLESEAAQKQQDNQPFERQPELAELAQREREAQQRLEQLAAVFEDHPLQKSIAEETRSIAENPIEKARERFQQAEAAPIHQQREQMRKAIKDLSTADKQLDELLKQFDELAALERDLQQLQQLAEEAERLADDVDRFERDWDELERLQKEQALSEQQQQTEEAQLADRQMDLQDEQEDLTSALDHLIEERPEILEAARQRQLEQLRELAEQAKQLADHQDRLATSMSRESAETEKQDPAEQQPTQAKPADDEATPGESPPPASDAPREESPVERQQQLAADAARQALETARHQGVDSDPAQEARRFAERAREAAQEAERGLLSEAAKSAQQAAEAAEQTSERMSESPEPSPARMMEQAEALAERQTEVAEQLRESSRSAEQRRAAQQQGQQQIAQETGDLAQQLAEAAERLGSEPLNEEQAGEQARSAQEATEEAQSSQEEAQQEIEQQRPREAAQPARQAAQSLRQAARRAAQAGRQNGKPEESPVPGEVGEQVCDARRQLEQAGQQLQQASPTPRGQPGNESEAGQSSESNPGQQPGQQPGESPEGTQPSETGQQGQSPEAGNQPGENGQPSGQPGGKEGQSQPGQSGQPGENGQPTSQPSNRAGSESMRDVAESLQQAAQQMGLQRSQRSQNNGQDQQSGNADQGADGPQGGYGARGGLSLADLEAELGRISARNWGQLPDRVESELQQAQQKKPDGDYARLIRLYFEEVARRQSAADGLEASGGRQPTDSGGSPETGRPSND